MLVVMVAIGGVTVPVMLIVDMIAVRDGRVAAARAVRMLMSGMGHVRQRMLVVMILMRRMGVALMHIVDMSLTLDACVPAARPVLMRVASVNVIIVGCH